MYYLNSQKVKILSLLLPIFFLMLSCTETEEKEIQGDDWTKERSIEFGKSLAFEQEMEIKLYLKLRPEWEMVQTGTGLRYWVYEKSEDTVSPIPGQTVEVNYEVRLLNDSLCYQTEEGEVSTFLVDKSHVESGIQEGIKYMTPGDRAKFIIPSHLAHGLVGDFEKIPPLQVLVVDMELKTIR